VKHVDLISPLSMFLSVAMLAQAGPAQESVGIGLPREKTNSKSFSSASLPEKVLHSFDFGKDGYNPRSRLTVDGNGNVYGTTRIGGPAAAGIAFELKPKSGGGWTETVLHIFGGDNDFYPSDLIFDGAGNLYGTTSNGGLGYGAVFELMLTATGKYKISTVYSFRGGSDGAYPASRLVFDSSGNLYGTTQFHGGSGCNGQGCGTVFELTPANAGWTETVIHSFRGGSADGGNPVSGLILDTSGNLYGVTQVGGAAQCRNQPLYTCGVVFELTPHSGGWTESILYDFAGGHPSGELLIDPVGNLFGTTIGDGRPRGRVFELTHSGGQWTYSNVHLFSGGSDGRYPVGGVTIDASGNLYGVTEQGTGQEWGAVFELTPASDGWTERALYHFKAGSDGLNPQAGVTFDSAGNLFGTTYQGGGINSCSLGCGAVFELKPKGGGKWSESLPHSFSSMNNGVDPGGPVVFDSAGNLFGTTIAGGNDGGTVFKLIRKGGGWQYDLVYRFRLYNSKHPDGEQPTGGLVIDGAGILYGTTSSGGTCQYSSSCGTLFKLTPKSGGGWRESILYNFCVQTNCPDGYGPTGSLIFDAAGNLYGTTFGGGAYQGGTVFRVDPTGKETVLYSFQFQPKNDVSYPLGPLLFDAAGNLYGTAINGGPTSPQCPRGCGGVFELVRSGNGWTESVLHLFLGGTDGAYPSGNLVFDGLGNLYGTTQQGGSTVCQAGCGTVFELTPSNGDWTESLIYTFQGGNDGVSPFSGLTPDISGNMYGTTEVGGGGQNCGGNGFHWCGSVFELSPNAGGGWSESVLYGFNAGTDGVSPSAPVILDSAGNIYGTAGSGGVPGAGVVFELTR
jgi:uncharacterized repeat protein (TIGR03803 family)